MKFNLGDIISTTVLLCMFLAIFFVMIHMIKKMVNVTINTKIDAYFGVEECYFIGFEEWVIAVKTYVSSERF